MSRGTLSQPGTPGTDRMVWANPTTEDHSLFWRHGEDAASHPQCLEVAEDICFVVELAHTPS